MKNNILMLILLFIVFDLNAVERINKKNQSRGTSFLSYSKSIPATEDAEFLNSSNAIEITSIYSHNFKRIHPFLRIQLNMFSNTDANPDLFIIEKNNLNLIEISINTGVDLIILPDKDFTPIFKIEIGTSFFIENYKNDIQDRIGNLYVKDMQLYSFSPGIGIKYKIGNDFNLRALASYRLYYPLLEHKTYEFSIGLGYTTDYVFY